jgi:hypothetical protein
MFEQVKDYKSACAVLGKKPIDKRRKLDEHVILYIMLSTITEAINFIANGNKPWIPVYQTKTKLIKTWYSWWYIDWNKIKDGSTAGLFRLDSYGGLSLATACVGTHLRFINKEAAEYAAKTFQPLYMKHIFGID